MLNIDFVKYSNPKTFLLNKFPREQAKRLTKLRQGLNINLFGDRLVVGRLVLVQLTGVRVSVPEPQIKIKIKNV